MRLFRFLVLATAAIGGVLLAPGVASAHALKATVTVAATVKVEAFFDDDTPAELGEVTVTDANGKVVLTGKTDERGVWTFPAPKPGEYTLTVKSIGHVAKQSFRVEGEPDAPPVAYTDEPMNKTVALVIGVGVLLGVSAVAWLLQGRPR